MKSTADKYWFIRNHPKFLNDDHVLPDLDIEVHNVCPETNRIEDYALLNTKSQIWIEFMVPWYDETNKKWERSHDWECDCGGWTMDEAIDELYKRVFEKYGDYTDAEYDARWDELYDPHGTLNSSSVFGNQFDSIWEDRHNMQYDVMDASGISTTKSTLERLNRTLEVLHERMKVCKPEEVQAISSAIESVEHDILENEFSLSRGIDFT